MRFCVLGPLVITNGAGRQLGITRLKQRRLLAALLLRPNSDVSIDQLAEDVWDGDPPSSVRSNLKTYVAGLRRAGIPVTTAPDGYRMDAGPEQLDSLAFEELKDEAPGALSLWRGPVLCGLPLSPAMAAIARRMQDLRFRLLETLPVSAIGPDLMYSLREAIDQEPLREDLYAQLMRSLCYHHRAGEAVQVYHDLRSRLAIDLGIDPGREVQALYLQVLTTDPALEPSAGGEGAWHSRAAGPWSTKSS